jgi:two-component system chemotaxis response regulator CheB
MGKRAGSKVRPATGRRDIVVVGASAGGVEALAALVEGLPEEFPAALFVVMHLYPEGQSVLPDILRRAGRLPAEFARERELFELGRIYVAPPDRQLILHGSSVETVLGPRENGHRPAVDALFRSAAAAHGPAVIGVVLTGSLDCGTAGLEAIKRMGGLAVVQDPDEALAPNMPESAIAHVAVDHVVRIRELPPLLVRLVQEPIPSDLRRPTPEVVMDLLDPPGEPTEHVCPECGGPLRRLEQGKVTRYRCQVGHAYGAESLIAEKARRLEAGLWAALSTLKERENLLRELEERARSRNYSPRLLRRYADQVRDAQVRAALIQTVLFDEDLIDDLRQILHRKHSQERRTAEREPGDTPPQR